MLFTKNENENVNITPSKLEKTSLTHLELPSPLQAHLVWDVVLIKIHQILQEFLGIHQDLKFEYTAPDMFPSMTTTESEEEISIIPETLYIIRYKTWAKPLYNT